MYKLTFKGNSSIITNTYFPPLLIEEPSVAALTSFTTYNTIANVNEKNNYIKIGTHEIYVDKGSYEFKDIKKFLSNKLQKIDPSITFSLKGNVQTQSCEMLSNQVISFDRANHLGHILGFRNRRYLKENTLHMSNVAVNVMNVNQIKIACDFIKNSYLNSQMDKSLYDYPIDVAPGYKIISNVLNPVFLPIIYKELHEATVSLYDQNNNILDLQGEEITINIIIKPERLI
jgi:hypothetical protein